MLITILPRCMFAFFPQSTAQSVCTDKFLSQVFLRQTMIILLYLGWSLQKLLSMKKFCTLHQCHAADPSSPDDVVPERPFPPQHDCPEGESCWRELPPRTRGLGSLSPRMMAAACTEPWHYNHPSVTGLPRLLLSSVVPLSASHYGHAWRNVFALALLQAH